MIAEEVPVDRDEQQKVNQCQNCNKSEAHDMVLLGDAVGTRGHANPNGI